MHTGPQKRRRRQQSVCASCLSFRACPALILSTPFRAILIFNHPSYVDAAAIAVMFTPSSVSKAGVAELPFIGLFGLALQLFFIERRGSNDAANPYVLRGDVVAAIAQRAADRRYPLVAMAPEATTKARPCLLKFRRGAFVTGQPVCPVLLTYRFRHFNPGVRRRCIWNALKCPEDGGLRPPLHAYTPIASACWLPLLLLMPVDGRRVGRVLDALPRVPPAGPGEHPPLWLLRQGLGVGSPHPVACTPPPTAFSLSTTWRSRCCLPTIPRVRRLPAPLSCSKWCLRCHLSPSPAMRCTLTSAPSFSGQTTSALTGRCTPPTSGS